MNKDIILSYYNAVDKNEYDKLFDLFSENVTYNRGGRIIDSKNALKNFYLNERKLEGNHELEDVVYSDNRDCFLVVGKFLDLHKGEIPFVDIFYLDDRGKIFKRMTYLLAGIEQTI